eukprot:CAMPEP_0175328020 /NCGR_PEP_ID=MMETSP0093-20121207/75340_1 /TAXON_ID=311494 /ORGANISM="Alexandrium monilatum, Strain CCMP3105" /LENGTH=50 /DNA_ID=CAMNT_0016625057 /DNA_START=101 /DNA_END=250 /DNA_ORIENTATION=-
MRTLKTSLSLHCLYLRQYVKYPLDFNCTFEMKQLPSRSQASACRVLRERW